MTADQILDQIIYALGSMCLMAIIVGVIVFVGIVIEKTIEDKKWW